MKLEDQQKKRVSEWGTEFAFFFLDTSIKTFQHLTYECFSLFQI
jgi:hypothetical protein